MLHTNKPTLLCHLPFRFHVSKSTLCFWLMVFMCWLMSSLLTPFKCTWFCVLHCFVGAIGCKWVYKVQHNAYGLMDRYKTRLITKGYAKTYDIDYEENYSTIVKMTITRIIIVMATIKQWF